MVDGGLRHPSEFLNANPPQTSGFSISGQVTSSGSGLAGVTMTLSGDASKTTTTDSNGNYTFTGLANGFYTITPSKVGCTFSPLKRDVTISGNNVTGQDFTATCQPTNLTVTAPNGGETWPIGSTQTIQWTSTGVNGDVKIELSRDGGTTWTETLFASTPNDESEAWPVTGLVTPQARIRISSVSAPSISDVSDGNFVISDPTPPSSSITSPTAGQVIGGTTLTIIGSANDNVAVSGVQVSTDGGSTWNTATCTGCPGASVTWSYPWTLPPTGSYTLKSRATDSSGNVETPGAGVPVTVDKNAPTSTITAPVNNSFINLGSPNPYPVAGTASDTGGGVVAKVEVSTDGGSTWIAATNTGTNFSTWSYAWNLPPDGVYAIKSRATDSATNVANVEIPRPGNTVTVDRIRPTVSSTSPANGATGVPLNANVTITWNENVDCASVTTTTVTISAGGWTKQSCSGSQAVFTTSGQANNTTYTVTVTTGVRDVAGNAMASDYPFSYRTVEDTTPPTNVQVTASTSWQTIAGTFTLKGTAQDNSGTIQKLEFYIDADSTPACSDTAPKPSGSTFQCPWDTTTKPNGPHTVTAKAYDPSNNFAPSPSVSFTINNGLTTFPASGRVTTSGGAGIAGVTMTFLRVSGTGAVPSSVQTDANGN